MGDDEEAGSGWRGGGQLVVAAPLQNNPWESFVGHSIIGLTFAVGLPFMLEVSYEQYKQHSVSHKELMKQAHVRSSCYFPPWGLVAASVIVFLGAWARLSCNKSLRNLICKESASYMPTALLAKVSGEHPDFAPDKEKWKPVRLCSLFLFLVAFSILPMLAWIDRAVWSAVSVDMFYACKKECLDVHGKDDGINKLDQLCTEARILEAHGTGAGWHDTGILPQITGTLGGYDEITLDGTKKACFSILKVNSTQYIRALLDKDNIVAAFDSRLKMAYHIGIIEVYGAALGISYFIMMFGSRLALRTKLRSLNNAKKELVSTHFFHTPEVSKKYEWMFERMHQYHGRFDDSASTKYWLTEVLKEGSEKSPEEPNWRNNVFEEVGEDDEDGRLDSNEPVCNCEKFWAALLGVLFAAGHTCMPGLFRVSSVFGGRPQPFFGSEEVLPPLAVNAFFMFIFNAFWFAKFVQCFYDQEEKLQLTIAFDCLWRFPGENPIKTTLREEKPLLDEVQDYRQRKGEENRKLDHEFRSGEKPFFFSEDGYRAEWGILHGEKLWQELYKLDEWYHMRRYIQIDQFDERISMELAIVVALLSLVPKILVISYNFLVLSSKESKLQPINFVTLYDCLFVLAFVFRGLMITLAFSDHYHRHRESLLELLEHIKLEMSVEGAKPKTTAVSQTLPGTLQQPVAKNAEAEKKPRVYEREEAVKFVETFKDALDRFDAPASFFGVKVSRELITGFSSTALLLVAPQLFNIFQDICKDF